MDNKELFRQSLHAAMGIALAFLIYWGIVDALLLFEIIILAGFLSFAVTKIDIPLLTPFLDKYERKEDRHSFPGRGPIYMLVGSLLALELFSRDIALGAIMIVAVGDASSHLFGQAFGSCRNPFNISKLKFFEGTAVGILMGFIGASFFLPVFEAFLAAAGAMLIEAVEIDMNKRPVNDNLIVPLVAGTVVFLLRTYF
jgi:dolichol kinase